MAIRQRTRSLVGYGLDNALQNLAPQVIQANRAPTTSDTAPQGACWVWQANSQIWFNSGIINGLAQWLLLESSGGPGVFSSLLVNPGPVTTQGTGAVNISADAVATTINVGTGAAVKTVSVGNTTAGTTVAFSTPSGTAVTSANGFTATAGGLTATAGNITATNGNVVLSTAATYVQLPGPIKIMSGAGAPANGLAAEVGDMYINTTAASASTRIYVATAANTWTNVTCAA